MKFNLFGRKRPQVEKYRDDVIITLDRISKGVYNHVNGYDKLNKLGQEIYECSKTYGDEECLTLWKVVSRIRYSLVSEQDQHLGRVAEEEIHYKERLGTVLTIGTQQINLSKESQLERAVEEEIPQPENSDVLVRGNGHGRR